MAVSSATSCAARFLQLELKKILSEPVEGFKVSLPEDSDFSTWDVSIFGPPDTLYEGGYFKVCSAIYIFVFFLLLILLLKNGLQ